MKIIQAKQGVSAPPPNFSGSGGLGGGSDAGGAGGSGGGDYAAGLPGSVKGPGHILWWFSWKFLIVVEDIYFCVKKNYRKNK